MENIIPSIKHVQKIGFLVLFRFLAVKLMQEILF